jgi:hypothetical protein
VEERQGVARQRVLTEDDGVPFKKLVGLVARQEELEETREDTYAATFCHLPGISKRDVVWKSELSKPHEGKETNTQLGVKKDVVMGAGVIVRGADDVEVCDGQGTFPDSGSPT